MISKRQSKSPMNYTPIPEVKEMWFRGSRRGEKKKKENREINKYIQTSLSHYNSSVSTTIKDFTSKPVIGIIISTILSFTFPCIRHLFSSQFHNTSFSIITLNSQLDNSLHSSTLNDNDITWIHTILLFFDLNCWSWYTYNPTYPHLN